MFKNNSSIACYGTTYTPENTMPSPTPAMPIFLPSSTSACRKQAILISQVLSTIRLSEASDSGRIQPPGFLCAPCRHSKAQWGVVHRVHYHTLMLWAILRPSSNMRLDDMPSIQERHLSIRLDPDLVARVLRENWKCGDVKSELSGLGEFTQASSQRQQLVS